MAAAMSSNGSPQQQLSPQQEKANQAGNACYKRGDFAGAAAAFTQAIDAHATAGVPAQLLSNRSAAYMGLEEHRAVRQNPAELFGACRQRARHVRRMWNRR